MSQRGFDAWLTTEPDPFPIQFNFDPTALNYDWCLAKAVQQGKCDSCKCDVGITLIETGNGGTSGMITNYYQLDEDAELLWCEECHDYEPEEK